MAHPEVVDQQGRSARCSCWSASTSCSARCRSSASARRRRRSSTSPRSASSRRRKAIKPDSKKLNPIIGPEEPLQPATRSSSRPRTSSRSAIVGAIVALAVLPEARRARGAGRHARRRSCCRSCATMILTIAQRAAIAYLVDRPRRLRLPAPPHREGAEDGQGGGQGGVQAAGAACRGQARAEAQGHGARPRAHDGRRSHRRRDRHQPDPLLRRAQVRRATSPAPIVVAKGVDDLALQDPRSWRGRRRRRSSPTRRSRARCTPPSRSGVRSPRTSSTPSRSSSPTSTASPARGRSRSRHELDVLQARDAPLRPARRGRRRPDRGDADHPAAADAAGLLHHAQHLGAR